MKDSLIKYYSNNEILLCLSAKLDQIDDIYFYCYMLKFDSGSLSISNKILALTKISGDANVNVDNQNSGDNN